MTTAPIILVPCDAYDGSDWAGGKTYISNFLGILSALPPVRRPRVFIVTAQGNNSPFIDSLLRYSCIAGQVDNSGGPLRLRGDIEALVKTEAGMIDADRLRALLTSGATFPASSEKAPNPVFWIHDFQHRHLPQMFSPEQLAQRDQQHGTIAAMKVAVVLSSADALADFHRFHPDAACTPKVWSFCSTLDPLALAYEDPRPKYGLKPQFFYIPNQFWKHKDFETAIRALALLAERGQDVTMVVTGPTSDFRHPGHFDEMMALARSLGVAERFRHLGLLPRAEQLAVFRACAAVLQPSRFEGWSTVIEDARAIGRPIILSDIAVHREQVGESGHFFPLGDPGALADLLETLAPRLPPGPDPEAETRASAANQRRMIERAEAFLGILPKPAPSAREEWPKPVYEAAAPVNPELALLAAPGETQWYAPLLLDAATAEARLWSGGYAALASELLERLGEDAYTIFLRRYLRSGLAKFGNDWHFADIVSVLLCLADLIRPRRYLEIGVRRGRSASAVASRAPEVEMVLCDMWIRNYAGIDNPGPELVAAQLKEIGHRGGHEFLSGSSHVEIPKYLAAHPERFFDLITVDGDHSRAGAALDLANVLPRLSIGGAVVFDDIAHPKHPELAEVWHKLVAGDPRFSAFSFTALGYGVGFAIRQR
jgi:predicted O-methyltransferase YrrM